MSKPASIERSFTTLCPDVCLSVLGQLAEPRDLARISCISKELNTYVKGLNIWETLVRAAWRYGGSASASSLNKHNGDWKAMYSSRMSLPRSFLLACDVIGAATSSMQEASIASGGRVPGFMLSAAFDKVARALVSVSKQLKGAAKSSHAALKVLVSSRELMLCKQGLVWWLQEAPQVVITFARQTRQLAFTSPSGRCSCAASVEWQRQALKFLLDLALARVHPSIGNRLERELEQLETCMAHKVEQQPCSNDDDDL